MATQKVVNSRPRCRAFDWVMESEKAEGRYITETLDGTGLTGDETDDVDGLLGGNLEGEVGANGLGAGAPAQPDMGTGMKSMSLGNQGATQDFDPSTLVDTSDIPGENTEEPDSWEEVAYDLDPTGAGKQAFDASQVIECLNTSFKKAGVMFEGFVNSKGNIILQAYLQEKGMAADGGKPAFKEGPKNTCGHTNKIKGGTKKGTKGLPGAVKEKPICGDGVNNKKG